MTGLTQTGVEHGRRQAVLASLAEEGLEYLLVTRQTNVRYLTGFSGSAGWLLLGTEAPVLVTDSRYEEQAEGEALGCTVHITGSGLVAGLVSVAGPARRVAFESDHVTHAAWQELAGKMPQVEWLPVGSFIEAARAVKDAGEIESISKALELAESVLQTTVDGLGSERGAVSEQELAARLEFGCRRGGAERMAFDTIVASGPRGALPHARPGPGRLDDGVPSVVDMGCLVDGYCSDLTRTLVAGGALPPRWERIHLALVEAQEAALQRLAAGVAAADVDAAARAVLRGHGLEKYFVHSLGHGVGLDIHEAPRLSANSSDVLASGMVVTLEPGVYISGEGGMRLEDMALVTVDGARRLNQLPATPLCVR